MDLAAAREIFEASQDLTVGIEEEFALVDPDTLELVPRFEDLRDDGAGDPVLAEAIAGELISSEIEIRSGRGETSPTPARSSARPAGACSRSPTGTASRSPRPAPTRSRTTASSTSSTPSTTTASRTA